MSKKIGVVLFFLPHRSHSHALRGSEWRRAIPIFLAVFFCASSAWAYTVRVAVLQNIDQFSLSVEGPYEVFPLYSSESLFRGEGLKEAAVIGTPAGIQIADQEFPVFGIAIRPDKKRLITLNQRQFRGRIDIYREQDETLLVINHVDVEDYLQGVLYHEISHHWPFEVLKAQAIAARTYALYQTTVSSERDYDVTSDIFSQVYGGATSEKHRTNRAIQATQGEILIWNKQIFPAYFHATCGGHTLASRELWNMDIPPLQGVECSYCQSSPHYRWKRAISVQEVLKKLKAQGYVLGDIDAIESSRTAPGGRALDLVIYHPDGALQIPANAFRLAVGPNLIRSTFFTAELKGGTILFNGKGWGHGVGLCQWGAYTLGKNGWKADQILKYYYPGAEIAVVRER